MKMLSLKEASQVVGGLSDANTQSMGRLRYFLRVLGPSLTNMGGALEALGTTKTRPKAADKQGQQQGADV